MRTRRRIIIQDGEAEGTIHVYMQAYVAVPSIGSRAFRHKWRTVSHTSQICLDRHQVRQAVEGLIKLSVDEEGHVIRDD